MSKVLPRLQEGCSHIVASLFKAEGTIKKGYTETISNPASSQWSKVFSIHVKVIFAFETLTY